jgi:hypothetical protein
MEALGLLAKRLQFGEKDELLELDVAVDAEGRGHLQQVEQEKPIDGGVGGRTHGADYDHSRAHLVNVSGRSA